MRIAPPAFSALSGGHGRIDTREVWRGVFHNHPMDQRGLHVKKRDFATHKPIFFGSS
jgi:hypothetical protein